MPEYQQHVVAIKCIVIMIAVLTVTKEIHFIVDYNVLLDV